jgi:hypothetical protein
MSSCDTLLAAAPVVFVQDHVSTFVQPRVFTWATARTRLRPTVRHTQKLCRKRTKTPDNFLCHGRRDEPG